jgi:hypothetical protein
MCRLASLLVASVLVAVPSCERTGLHTLNTGTGGMSALGGVAGTGGVQATGGRTGAGGAGSGAGGSSPDTCYSDADCVTCIWETAPADSSQCTGSYCCGGWVTTTARCEANQAAWNFHCPNQYPSEGACGCPEMACPGQAVPGLTCVGGQCVLSCPPSTGGSTVLPLGSGGSPGTGGAGVSNPGNIAGAGGGMGGAKMDSGGIPGAGGAGGAGGIAGMGGVAGTGGSAGTSNGCARDGELWVTSNLGWFAPFCGQPCSVTPDCPSGWACVVGIFDNPQEPVCVSADSSSTSPPPNVEYDGPTSICLDSARLGTYFISDQVEAWELTSCPNGCQKNPDGGYLPATCR